MKRRDFVKKLSTSAALTAGVGTLALAQNSAEKNININKKRYEWRIVTTWPPNFPVLGEAVVQMAKELEIASGGRMRCHVYGGGELVSALETFDAVILNGAQMGHGAPYYWAGKMPSTVFFGAIPFGLNAQQMTTWLFEGGGLQIWQDLYDQAGIIPFPCGNTGVQMGGWFNKEINTVADLKGLKMRIPGLGGKVIDRAGGSAITIAGGEVYLGLERGVIDAAEWIGPYHDYIMGFHKVARYYYAPGWHETGSNLELLMNKSAFLSLPKDLQALLSSLIYKHHVMVLSEFEAKNNRYLKKILAEKGKGGKPVELRRYPKEVLLTLRTHAEEIVDEIIAQDPWSKRAYESMQAFKSKIKKWHQISEFPLYQLP